MKIFLYISVIVFSALALAFTYNNSVFNKSEVEQEQGLFIFIRSKPINEYTYLGTFEPKVVKSKTGKSLISEMIKRGKEKFPEANGIIFSDDLFKVDLIKFK